MTCRISFRTIEFKPSTNLVRVVVTTDIDCIVFCRVSSNQPQVHLHSTIIRGLPVRENPYFCFTAYQDFSQYELTEGKTHTFWVTDWPVCTIRWLYFWGMVGSEICISTSASFKWHNDGVGPVPPPEQMKVLNAIDPEYFPILGDGAYHFLDLSFACPQGSTGALIIVKNLDSSLTTGIAIRQPGDITDPYSDLNYLNSNHLICGFDSLRRIEVKVQNTKTVGLWVMAYTGPQVIFPTTHIDIKPTSSLNFKDFDIKSSWPSAQLILTRLWASNNYYTGHSIRPLGSSRLSESGRYQVHPFCQIPPGGNIQTRLNYYSSANQYWEAYAYIKEDIISDSSGVSIPVVPSQTFAKKLVNQLYSHPYFVFLEYNSSTEGGAIAARKDNSYFAFTGSGELHNWCIVHANETAYINLTASGTGAACWLMAISK